MSAHLLDEAAKHIKTAQKQLKKGLTKWTISQEDHDVAALEYERAAKVYVHAKMQDKAVETYQLAIKEHGQAGETGPFGAGRCNDAIATIYKDQKNIAKYAEFAKHAAVSYLEDGKADKYADTLVKASRVLKETDPKGAAAMMKDAIETMGEQEMWHFMPDPLRTLTGIYCKDGDYLGAVEQVKKQMEVYKMIKQDHNIEKAMAEVVLLHLARNDVILAERECRQLSGDYGCTGELTYTCNDLLEAYQEGDDEAVKAHLAKQCFTFLTPDIARMTRKITVTGVKKAKKPVASPQSASPTAAAAPASASASPSPPAVLKEPEPEPVVEEDGDGDDLADWQ